MPPTRIASFIYRDLVVTENLNITVIRKTTIIYHSSMSGTMNFVESCVQICNHYIIYRYVQFIQISSYRQNLLQGTSQAISLIIVLTRNNDYSTHRIIYVTMSPEDNTKFGVYAVCNVVTGLSVIQTSVQFSRFQCTKIMRFYARWYAHTQQQ